MTALFRKLEDAPQTITVFIDGEASLAEEGESLAAILARQSDFWSRKTPNSSAKRAPYCMMGVCFECLANVDGVSSTQTCLTAAKDGMRVERQIGRRTVI